MASRRRHPCHERGIQIATARHGTEIFQSKFKLPMIREPGGWAAAAVRIVYRDGVSVPVPRAAECLRLCDVDVAAKTPFAAAATWSAVARSGAQVDGIAIKQGALRGPPVLQLAALRFAGGSEPNGCLRIFEFQQTGCNFKGPGVQYCTRFSVSSSGCSTSLLLHGTTG